MLFYAKSQSLDSVHIQVHTLVPELGTVLHEKWRECLEIDEYGGPGTAHIPSGWIKQYQTVSSHPEIFSEFFYIPNHKVSRADILKIAFLGPIIDDYLSFSLQYAYSILGDKLPLSLARNVSRFNLPSYQSPEVNCDGLMDSVRNLVVDMLEKPPSQGKFDAIAKFETAAFHVSTQKPVSNYEIIETRYDPKQLINSILNDDFETDIEEISSFHMVIWDRLEETLRSIPIRPDLADILRQDTTLGEQILEELLQSIR